MFRTETILTDRESQVVLGYVNGDNGKEIADEYCMAYRTVVNHTQNAFEKAGCKRSIHALVSWWYRTNFPEVAQKVGAMILVLGLVFNIHTQEPQRRVRRATRRQRIEFIETVTAA